MSYVQNHHTLSNVPKRLVIIVIQPISGKHYQDQPKHRDSIYNIHTCSLKECEFLT